MDPPSRGASPRQAPRHVSVGDGRSLHGSLRWLGRQLSVLADELSARLPRTAGPPFRAGPPPASLPGTFLSVTVALFTGVSGGSGDNFQSSRTNYPLAYLERQDNEQASFVPVLNCTADAGTVVLPATLQPGWH